MDDKVLLTKIITLLFRESQLPNKTENSAGLVRTALQTIVIPENTIGMSTERDLIAGLKNIALEMSENPTEHLYDSTTLLQRLRIECRDDSVLYSAFSQGIIGDFTEEQVSRMVLNLRRSISENYRQDEISKVLGTANYAFKYQRASIENVDVFLSGVIAKLEALSGSMEESDPAILGELDAGNEVAMRSAFEEARRQVSGSQVYQSGWQDFNLMTQGGLRPATLTIINALQHKYKTGFSLSLFRHLVTFNQAPKLENNKIPLALRISFEDDIVQNLQFMYQEMRYSETREFVDIRTPSIEEMTEYVKKNLSVGGFATRMIRVDPTQWTYRSIINKIIEIESKGYQCKFLMLDYLGMVPTTGCVTTGPTGTDMRDLFRRIRNFCAARDIVAITPHQLSTQSKDLLRGGMTPDSMFTREVAEKGYTSGSKQLDQEVDLEVYIHLFKHNKDTYLSVCRGKHRIPTILEDDAYRHFYMKFPKGMPIPTDVGREEKVSVRKITSQPQDPAAADLFAA